MRRFWNTHVVSLLQTCTSSMTAGFRLTVHKDDSFHIEDGQEIMARIAMGSGGYMDRTLVFTDNTAQIDLEGLPLDWYTLALIDQQEQPIDSEEQCFIRGCVDQACSDGDQLRFQLTDATPWKEVTMTIFGAVSELHMHVLETGAQGQQMPGGDAIYQYELTSGEHVQWVELNACNQYEALLTLPRGTYTMQPAREGARRIFDDAAMEETFTLSDTSHSLTVIEPREPWASLRIRVFVMEDDCVLTTPSDCYFPIEVSGNGLLQTLNLNEMNDFSAVLYDLSEGTYTVRAHTAENYTTLYEVDGEVQDSGVVEILENTSHSVDILYQNDASRQRRSLRVRKRIQKEGGCLMMPGEGDQFVLTISGCGSCHSFYLSKDNQFCVELADLCPGCYQIEESDAEGYVSSLQHADGERTDPAASDAAAGTAITGHTGKKERRTMRIQHLDPSAREDLLRDLLKRSPDQYGAYEAQVAQILEEVREKGDEALFAYTERFDGAKLSGETVLVTEEEIREAYQKVPEQLVAVIRRALKNIEDYHAKQKQYSWFDSKPDGTILGQKVTPLKRVGVYVPGGKAAYPSSVLMNILPAKVAGVEEILMVTPPGKDGKVTPTTLVAAHEAGATAIYKAGGAQAVAALAYGTESIPKVDKIVGPGNIYVALAKKAVYGHVSIDAIAGPSEILVIADETADPRYVAADLLSQAEHDELASAILITTSQELAEAVSGEVDQFLTVLSRAEIIRKSLDNYGYILVADTMDEAVEIANEIASEHLEIQTRNPYDVMTKIRNAGAIFLGPYASEPLGDYFAGPNHVLPTNGTAKFFSPLSVDDFIKKSSIIAYSREALQAVHEDIETFAKAEGLTAHANSIHVRFEEQEGDR